MCISKNDFKWIFGINSNEMEMENNINPEFHSLYYKLKNLTMTRKNKVSEFLNKNLCFASLTESQKVQLNLFIQLVQVILVSSPLRRRRAMCSGREMRNTSLSTAIWSIEKTRSN